MYPSHRERGAKLKSATLGGWIFLVLCSAATVEAQEPDAMDPVNLFIPVPILFYTPETEFAFGAACSYIYRPSGSTVHNRPSNMSAALVMTTRSQATIALSFNHYWDRERQNAFGPVS